MDVFVGREAELQILDDLFSENDGRMLVVYGRRRIGKTYLIREWVLQQKNQDRILYFTADMLPPEMQRTQFAEALSRFEYPDVIPPKYHQVDWNLPFQTISRLADSDERLVVIIDEFTYLLTKQGEEIASVLQRYWDTELKHKNILLILSGSYVGMMHKHVLTPKAPLYGRADRVIHLLPLNFRYTRNYFPQFASDARVALYSIFGGIPGYWDRILPGSDFTENIKQILLTSNSAMHGEPRLLLYDHFKDPERYLSIMQAISHGNRTYKEIGAAVNLKSSQLTWYMSQLSDIGMIEPRKPVTATPKSRDTRWHVTDPFLRFYYRFIAPRINQINLGQTKQIQKELKAHLIDFIGTYTWEELCQEWVLRAAWSGAIPVNPDLVGGEWNKTAQVDVFGINNREKTLFLGESKWTTKSVGAGVLTKLVEQQGPAVIPTRNNWKVFFAGFSRSGWKESAIEYAEKINNEGVEGENWQSVGMILIDLDQLDDDLYHWSS